MDIVFAALFISLALCYIISELLDWDPGSQPTDDPLARTHDDEGGIDDLLAW